MNSNMNIMAITIADPANPTEVQTWLDDHSNASILNINVVGTIVYIFYH